MFRLTVYLMSLTVLVYLATSSSLPAWGRVVSFVAFSALYCCSESILHEANHRTAFVSLKINNFVSYVAGLLAFKEPIRQRWVHSGHHAYTNFPDLDPEFALPAPSNRGAALLHILGFAGTYASVALTIQNAVKPDPEVRRLVPPAEHSRIRQSSWVCLGYYVTIVAASVALHSWWPVIFVFGGRLAGGWLYAWLTLPEHLALPTNVADWRRNTRTVHLNPLGRLLIWNVNFHVAHHMYPDVPFHRRSDLQVALGGDLPESYSSSWGAWRDVIVRLRNLQGAEEGSTERRAKFPRVPHGTRHPGLGDDRDTDGQE